MTTARLHIGCAGWNIPPAHGPEFPLQGSHLERYASTLPAVEINSSFYRSHQLQTYARWCRSVPEDFRFSVKLPKQITHGLKLQGAEAEIDKFWSETAGLGEKLGCLLVQLPPSLAFDSRVADDFFRHLRTASHTVIQLEPRHVSWTCSAARAVLKYWKVGLVFADPNPLDLSEPVILTDALYIRLHGSPVIYRSAYTDAYLDALTERLATILANSTDAWCIFDNTANGAASRNALDLLDRLMPLTAISARP
jgi:uncharacterized protein YecE (DUF72 family)